MSAQQTAERPVTAEIIAAAAKHGIKPNTARFTRYLRGWYARPAS